MWTFATARTKSTVTDLDEWDQMFKHVVPREWLSVFRVYTNVSDLRHPIESRGWKRESENILTRESTVYMWGLRRENDTGRYQPLFVQALAARLAAEMAIPLAENRELQRDLWGLYATKLADAAARDGQQGSNEYITQEAAHRGERSMMWTR